MNLSISNTVKDLLTKYPELRDSDERLILNTWSVQMPELKEEKHTVSFKMFSEYFKEKKLASTESIRRSRQKIQENYPSLRGKNYKLRKSNEKNIKKELKEI